MIGESIYSDCMNFQKRCFRMQKQKSCFLIPNTPRPCDAKKKYKFSEEMQPLRELNGRLDCVYFIAYIDCKCGALIYNVHCKIQVVGL